MESNLGLGPWGCPMRAAFLRPVLRSLLVLALGAALAACGGPTPSTIDVEGRVVGSVGEPLAGLRVHAGGAVATTDALGSFRLEGVRVPYTIVVASTDGDGWVHAFEGLDDPIPVLAPLLDDPPLVAGTVRGDAWGGAPVPDGHQVLVCAEGVSVPVWGCARVGAGAVGYLLQVAWTGSAAANVRLHALWMVVDGLGWPLGYPGYATAEVVVASEATTVRDLDATPLVGPTAPVMVSVSALGGSLAFVTLAADVGGAVAMPVYSGPWPVGPVDALLPPATIAPRAQVVALATFPPGGDAVGWATGDAGAPLTLALDAPPRQLAPVEDAVGVTPSTPFTLEAGPAAAFRFAWSPTNGTVGPSARVTTTSETVRLPDPTPFGLAYPAGGDYLRSVIGYEAPTSTGVGVGYVELVALYGFGGAPLEGDARSATSGTRMLTLAP
ncbi:MAG: hypothetical protein P1P87_07775 [Trueperaceae bacterium]|nr:hypothetical protein [Trueperaceae bacterium]